MATDFKSIPIIDIAPLLAKSDDPNMGQDTGVCEVVKQLDQACREAGFFYVKGHGIPENLIKEVRNITSKFFHLPYEEKLKIKMTPAAGYRGYQRIGENITKGVPDMHEAIDVRNLSGEWISAPPIPGTFVCNIGDMLKTNFDAAVEPLEVCVQKSGGSRKFGKATIYGEHLVSKVQTNFVV
ncbi:hypothetical protein COLO4_11463 [Corchorus olitorius]|uniref:Non-haem dioxygenase N-terminal domain-containing protein n=1 Tax=Corchorus olitorius TaxID=93759 RepID=A0A1R3K4C5_9ROSI|nr:hypothetical protein COLO4_11463 [Corchorus olitorius]